MDDLYPTHILALAADIPHVGALADGGDGRVGKVRKRSMVCGSEVEVSVRLDEDGRVADVGLDIEACALGQASASVFARHAIGATLDDVVAARDALEAMLKDDGPAPQGRFKELEALRVVQGYPRRHASTLLAFRAGAAAIEDALGHAPEHGSEHPSGASAT